MRILGKEDPRCPLGGLELPESRARTTYAKANAAENFKVCLALKLPLRSHPQVKKKLHTHHMQNDLRTLRHKNLAEKS